jgi:hypothetical protein
VTRLDEWNAFPDEDWDDVDNELIDLGNSGTRIPEILARSAAAGKTSSKFS